MLVLVGALLVAGAMAVVLGYLADRSTREVQGLADRYLLAVQRKDLPAALDTIDPEERGRWAAWIDHQTGNRYQVEGLAVRAPSLIARLVGGAGGSPTEVAITARITLESGEPWDRPAVTVVHLVRRDGRLWFREPPFHPPGGPDG